MAEKNFIVKGALETRETVSFDSNATIDGDLTVTGSATVTGNISFTSVSSGDVPAARLSGTIDSARIPTLTTSDIVAGSTGTGTFDSAALPALNAADITGGIFDSARIPTLKSGDLTGLTTADITSGIFDSARIPQLTAGDIQGLDAADISTGTFDSARIPTLAPNMFQGGSGQFDSEFLPPLNASDVTGGTFDVARIPELALGTNTSGNYVQSVTAGLGIQALSAASEGTAQTIKVDSSFVTGLFSATEGISFSGGVIGIDTTDSVTFANITATNEINIFDSANGSEAGHIEGDPLRGIEIHAKAGNVDGGIRFVMDNGGVESDQMIIYKDSGISVVNNVIHDVGTPVSSTDAANKSYVDAVAEGLHVHAPARVATVQALINDAKVNSVTYNNGTDGVGAYFDFLGVFDSVDGVNLDDGDRIIVKNEATEAYNGIYVRTSTTRITRADDFDTPAEIAGGDFIFTQEGTINANIGFAQTRTITSTRLGDSDIIFAQFSGAENITAGDGLSKTGNRFDVDLSATSGLEFSGGELRVDAADNSVQIVSTGLRIPQTGGGIAVEHLDLDGSSFSGATSFTLANVLNATSETLDNLDAYDGDSNQFFTQARADSAIGKFAPGVVDSDYISLRRPAETIFKVTNDGSAAYNYFGDGFPVTRSNPTLTITPGKTYKFEVNASGHPFWLQKVSGAYSSGNVISADSGVVNNGAQVGNVFYTAPMDIHAPTKVYYVCQNHSNMGGPIILAGAHDSDLTKNQIDSAIANEIKADIDSAINNDITGTASEVEVTAANGRAVIGLPASVAITTGLTVGGNSVLTTADEGSGNGIDADTLDGQEGSAYLRSNATDAYTSGTLTFNNGTTLTAADGATVNFSMADGTAPFTVTSTTNVPNLNASSLSGLASSAFLRSGASDAFTSGTLTFNSGTTLTAASGATVNFSNTTGTAPFTVASTTKVANLNADLLDGETGSHYRIDIYDSAGTLLNS